MYLLILYLPFLSFLNGTLFGRFLGRKGSPIYSCILMGLTFFLSLYVLYEVSFCNSAVYIHLNDWISVDILNVKALFYFDSLTSLMLLVVTSISFLVHVYSMSYMSEDPHLQRFISLLSLFTFFMIVLVTGSNLLQIFVGWEGETYCLKWLNTGWVWATNNSLKRIGPHNIDILSLIIGSTLGDSHIEKRNNGVGCRVIFEQSNRNVEYLMHFFKVLSRSGYCSTKKPKLKTRITRYNTVLHYYRINSYTFNSFNWIHDLFYTKEPCSNKFVKRISPALIDYINPVCLAYWFMDDGSRTKNACRIATCNFSLSDCYLLSEGLNKKFNLNTSVQICRTTSSNKKYYQIYIPVKDMPIFNELIAPHIITSMKYKLSI